MCGNKDDEDEEGAAESREGSQRGVPRNREVRVENNLEVYWVIWAVGGGLSRTISGLRVG